MTGTRGPGSQTRRRTRAILLTPVLRGLPGKPIDISRVKRANAMTTLRCHELRKQDVKFAREITLRVSRIEQKKTIDAAAECCDVHHGFLSGAVRGNGERKIGERGWIRRTEQNHSAQLTHKVFNRHASKVFNQPFTTGTVSGVREWNHVECSRLESYELISRDL